jgi:hypothetical protein
MRARGAFLGPADGQRGVVKIDLVLAKVDKLRGPQAMPVCPRLSWCLFHDRYTSRWPPMRGSSAHAGDEIA